MAALNALLEPEVESLGYRLVRVALLGGRSDPTLQVMAERPDTRQLDLDRLRDDLPASCPRSSTPWKRKAAIRSKAATVSKSARRASTAR